MAIDTEFDSWLERWLDSYPGEMILCYILHGMLGRKRVSAGFFVGPEQVSLAEGKKQIQIQLLLPLLHRLEASFVNRDFVDGYTEGPKSGVGPMQKETLCSRPGCAVEGLLCEGEYARP